MSSIHFGAIYKFKHGGYSDLLSKQIPFKQGIHAERFQVPHDDVPNADPRVKDWLHVVVSGQDALNYLADKAKEKQAFAQKTNEENYLSDALDDSLFKVDWNYTLKDTDAEGKPVVLVNSSFQATQIIDTLA